ncbi:hypothetical protein [Devosia chinhatensis]|nr:hypothetical protein [Devosia chinhatensis]
MAEKQNREQARETFRQFAWNLAGTLAAKDRPASRAQTGGSKRR